MTRLRSRLRSPFRPYPRTDRRPRGRGLLLAALVLASLAPAPLAIAATRSTTVTVTLPANPVPAPALGYNLGHFTVGSNAADWWRYSGLANARAFVSPSDIEPSDDLAPVGDGVTSLAGFESRRTLVRAATVARGTTDGTYVAWSAFLGRYRTATGDTNEFTVDGAFRQLRAAGVDILVNLTASPSRFPIASSGDWAGKWELWQHYYAQGFLLARDYGVHRFGTFNEPNNWTGFTPEDWLVRLQLCSDALRSGFLDARTRDPGALGGLAPLVYAPNTANGAIKYADWGRRAVLGQHVTYAGATSPEARLFDVYNYQKYSMTATGTGSSYADDATTLTSYIATDAASTGDAAPPLALTEFNVRTASDYDKVTATLDTPADFSQLGANAVTVAQRGVREIFLFKFAQTDRVGTYPVAKNGTHYVQNGATTLHRYGGATKGAEVWRLLNAACGPGRVMLTTVASRTSLYALGCRPAAGGAVELFLANPSADAHALTISLGALAPSGARVVVSEVSAAASGGVAGRATVGTGGTLTGLTMPSRSVWRVRIAAAASTPVFVDADADTLLGDGTAKATTGGSATTLQARADGTVNGRRVTVIGFPLVASATTADRVLLTLRASNATLSGSYQAHVYAIEGVSWSEGTLTWATAPFLRQGVAAGNLIEHGVVAGQEASAGTIARILGQLVTTSTSYASKQLDVTDYVRARALAGATRLTFIVVQDHRWDVTLPSLAVGDTQGDGIRIGARESGATNGPRLELIP
jgi:hypothetical protein